MSVDTLAKVLAGGATPLRARYQSGTSIAIGSSGSNLWGESLNNKGNDVPGVVHTDPATGAGSSFDRSTTGAILLPVDPGSSQYFRLLRAKHSAEGSGTSVAVLLVDRLCGVSGLVANTVASQAVNTPALPARAPTNGVGVIAGFANISAGAGGTNPTLTLGYTNQSGGASSVTTPSIGSTWSSPATDEFLLFPYASGDTGIQQVTTVQASSAGSSAGNYEIDLFVPIAFIPLTGLGSGSNYAQEADWLTLGLPRIHPQADLGALLIGPGTLGGSILDLELMIDG